VPNPARWRRVARLQVRSRRQGGPLAGGVLARGRYDSDTITCLISV
jgi:hypothetical protein